MGADMPWKRRLLKMAEVFWKKLCFFSFEVCTDIISYNFQKWSRYVSIPCSACQKTEATHTHIYARTHARTHTHTHPLWTNNSQWLVQNLCSDKSSSAPMCINCLQHPLQTPLDHLKPIDRHLEPQSVFSSRCVSGVSNLWISIANRNIIDCSW